MNRIVFALCLVSTVLTTPLSGQSVYRDTRFDLSWTGFGSSLAVGDGEVFVGEAGNQIGPGIVYVYRPDQSGNWVEAAQLTASDSSAGDAFGASVVVHGSTLFAAGSEGVYVFARDDDGVWLETSHLTPSVGGPEGGFGAAIALRDDIAFIAAPGANSGIGAVSVYRRGDDGVWTEGEALWSRNIAAGSAFGASLATDGDRLFVGAPQHNRRAGGVFVFGARDGTWEEIGTIQPEGAPFNTLFGVSLLMAGDELMVGVPGVDQFVGAVHVYQLETQANEWRVTGTLAVNGLERPAGMGISLGRAAGEVWVGAPFANDLSGGAYRFTRLEDGSWSFTGEVRGGGEQGDNFGMTLAAGEDVAVVGLTSADYGQGTALIFEREGDDWQAGLEILSESFSFDPVVGGQLDCTNGEASAFTCSAVDLVAFLPVKDLGGTRGVSVNDVWGWTDPETGKEYALVGRRDGTAFVDITDPSNPVFVGDLARTLGSPGSAWRDVKVYKDHAFIVADGAGAHGVQIFDLTQLRDISESPATFSETAHYDGIFSAHNIAINEETGFAFVLGSSQGGETCGGGLHMINIQDPANPEFAGCFAHPNTGRQGSGYTHDAQCVVYRGPDEEHVGREICFGANETALSIADVTDKENPVALAMASYPNVSYTHQGWLTEDQRHFFMNDELDEGEGNRTRTLIWDVADLDDPILLKEHFAETLSTDHNLYVVGDYMYQANYRSGLRVYDIRDPENPVEVGFFDTVPYGDDPGTGDGAWSSYPFFESGVIPVTSQSQGLFLVKKQPRQVIP